MNTHPIDPHKPRTGYLVTFYRSAGSTTKYARNDEELQEILETTWAQSATRYVNVKAVGDV